MDSPLMFRIAISATIFKAVLLAVTMGFVPTMTRADQSLRRGDITNHRLQASPSHPSLGDEVTLSCSFELHLAAEEHNNMSEPAVTFHQARQITKSLSGVPFQDNQVAAVTSPTDQLDTRNTSGTERIRTSYLCSNSSYNASLTIANFSYANDGCYSCLVWLENREEYKSGGVLLWATGRPIIKRDDLTPTVHGVIGLLTSLRCPFFTNPRHTLVKWYGPNGQLNDAQIKTFHVNMDEWETQMYIDHLQLSDLGQYTCTVANWLGNESFTFTLRGSPFVQIDGGENGVLTLDQTKNQTVVCCAANFPGASLQFFWVLETDLVVIHIQDGMEDFTIRQTGRFEGNTHTIKSSLVLQYSLQYVYRGRLNCSVPLGDKNYTSTVFLDIVGPPTVTSRSRRQMTSLGLREVLACTVVAYPAPRTFHWTFNTGEKGSEEHDIYSTPGEYEQKDMKMPTGSSNYFLTTLAILNVTEKHLGVYKCSATNEKGTQGDLVQVDMCKAGFEPTLYRKHCQGMCYVREIIRPARSSFP
ncbi:uncharacterized protein LOC101859510 [Aplysia californica]|uniref:Uncharacterized protein LOC101859510 n=1 Tax=Aplysia californica TaxID=6500 RepID=A0ABM1A9B4_APLCA|nr:uncharacterized protein LOC101859510 [Aplysia californica]